MTGSNRVSSDKPLVRHWSLGSCRVALIKREGEELNSSPSSPSMRRGRTLADRRAASACTRAGSIHADHAGLIGEVHVLSGGGRSDGRSRNRIRLIAPTRRQRKHITALLAG